MTFPALTIEGDTPRERGEMHGRALRDAIRRNVALCRERLSNLGAEPAEIASRTAHWHRIVTELRPAYADEVAAVADGAGLDILDVALVNYRFELLFPLMARRALERQKPPHPTDGCTSFALEPERVADGRMRMGQTLDGIAAIRPNLVVIESGRPSGIRTLALHEAGSVGPSLGINSSGIGLLYNSMATHDCVASSEGLPFRVRVAAIFEQADLDEAVREAVTLPRPTATYLLIGHESGRAVGLELERERHCIFHPSDGILTHANHLEGPGAAGSLFECLLPDSLFRSDRMRDRLASDGRIGEAEMRDALSDHFGYPGSICLHGDEAAPAGRRSVTLAAAILDPKGRRMALSAGLPCTTPFTVYAMSGSGAGPD